MIISFVYIWIKIRTTYTLKIIINQQSITKSLNSILIYLQKKKGNKNKNDNVLFSKICFNVCITNELWTYINY